MLIRIMSITKRILKQDKNYMNKVNFVIFERDIPNISVPNNY